MRFQQTEAILFFLSTMLSSVQTLLFKPPIYNRGFHTTTIRQLNRFLFDYSEINDDPEEKGRKMVVLPRDDYRTVHAAKVLGLTNGDTIRAGLVSCEEHGGLWTDEAIVQWIPEGKVKKAEVLKNGTPPGSLAIDLHNLKAPTDVSAATEFTSSDHPILVSLILALPRPLQLGRMLPMIAQMGVDQLVLTGARKVPKDYFGSHLFRKPEVLRDKLIEGLCQAGDVRLPQLHVTKSLEHFLEYDLDRLFPADEYARVIAHPQRRKSSLLSPSHDIASVSEPIRMRSVAFPRGDMDNPPRLVVAVGPEGGWEEPTELDLFEKMGFQHITLGARTLRSDCAVVSLLSLAHDVCEDEMGNMHSLQSPNGVQTSSGK